MSELAKAYVQIIPTMEGVQGKLESMLGDATEKASEDAGKAAGAKFQKGALVGVAALGTAASAIIGDAVSTTAGFDATMSEVAAISGATGEALDSLREKAKEMGSSTKFSASESAEALTYMAMAGWKTEDMLGGIEGIMNLAAAAGEDLAITSDIVTDALTAFGLSAQDSGHFADVLAAASSNANTNVSMLGESFKYVAPVAGSMKYTAEDTAVALGLMANAGIKSSQAGTAMRTLLTNMAKPAKEASVAMERLNLSLVDEEGNMKSLMDVMQDIREGFSGGKITQEEYNDALADLNAELATGGISAGEYELELETLNIQLNGATEAQMAETAAMLAGKEGMSGLLAIVNASDEDFAKLTDSIYGASDAYDGIGAAAGMAATMQDNLQGKTTTLKSKFEGLMIQIGEKLTPIVSELVDALSWAIDHADTLGPIIAGLATGFAIFAVAINVAGIIKKVSTAMAALNVIMAANPIGIVIAAVAALAVGLIALWNTNEDFRNWVKQAWEDIKGFFVGAWEAVKTAWEAAKDFFKGIWESISGTFSTVKETLSGFFSDAWNAIKGIWENSAVGGYFRMLWDVIKGIFEVVKDVLSGDFSGAWEAIKDVWNSVTGYFEGIWSDIKNVFSTAWEDFNEIGDNIVKGIWQGISDGYLWIKGKIEGWVGDVLSFFKRLLGISSPSKVFAQMGGFLAEGLGLGIEDNIGLVERAVGDMSDAAVGAWQADSLTASVAAAGSYRFGGAAAGYGSRTNSVVVNVYGAEGQSVDELARKVERVITQSIARKEAAWA